MKPFSAFAVVVLLAGPSLAASCRDKGKFVKCPPTAAAASASGVTKDAKGKCHFAAGPKKGQFTKCP